MIDSLLGWKFISFQGCVTILLFTLTSYLLYFVGEGFIQIHIVDDGLPEILYKAVWGA